MNLGLEVLHTSPAASAVSMESVFGAYVEMEQFNASSDRFFDYGDQLISAFENLLSLRATAKRYNSAESLAVLNDLVADDFNGNMTIASLEDGAGSIWQRIAEFFKKIWKWLQEFFYRVLNFFGGAENRLRALKGKLEAMLTGKGAGVSIGKPDTYGNITTTTGHIENSGDKGSIRPWYPMVDKKVVTEIVEELDTTVQKVKSQRASAKVTPTVEAANAMIAECEATIAHDAKVVKGERNTPIKTVRESIDFVEGVRKNISEAKKFKDQAKGDYAEFKGILEVTKKKQLIKEATAWQKATAAEMRMYNKSLSTAMRIAAHTLANCKPVRPGKK